MATLAETLHLRWVWDWTPGATLLHLSTHLVTDAGGHFGDGISFAIDLNQLPDGVQESLGALARWGKDELEKANPLLDIALPEGAQVRGFIELTSIGHTSYKHGFIVNGKARYSASVRRNLNALTWSLSDLPGDLREIVNALDAPIHDFALERKIGRAHV